MCNRTFGLARAALLAACTASCGSAVDHEHSPATGLLEQGSDDVRLDGDSDCDPVAGDHLDRYVATSRTNGELHIIGIHEAARAPGDDFGRFELEVERTGPSIVVLSAHEATEWIVRTAPEANIETILVTGYHAQRVQAPASVEVVNQSYAEGAWFFGNAYMWPREGEQCADFFPPATCDQIGDTWQAELRSHLDRARQLVDGVEEWSGRALDSFHGCRAMSQFTLRDDQTF